MPHRGTCTACAIELIIDILRRDRNLQRFMLFASGRSDPTTPFYLQSLSCLLILGRVVTLHPGLYELNVIGRSRAVTVRPLGSWAAVILVLRRRTSELLLLLSLTINARRDPREPNMYSNDGVGYASALRAHMHRVSPLETQPAIDDTKGDRNAAEPDVHVRPESTALVLLEQQVVDKTEERLQEHENEDHDTNDGMVMVKHLHT